MPWADAFLTVLKDNDVRLVTYVPDNVVTPLINGVAADNTFRSVCATREDEAIGMAAGAWMAGMKSVVMMQTSGFTLIANALAKGAGIANSQWVCDEAHFDELMDRRFENGGPMLIAAKIDDKAAPVRTPRDPTLIRIRFMQGMGTSRGGALDA